jgi:D-beta-D-heptose 7-phosphate kinase/D-beta-D-heptose 1-phosphate adenosyltransferase
LVDSKPKNVELFVDTFLVKPNFKEFCEMIWKNIENSDEQIEKYWKDFVKQMNTNLVITRWNKWASVFTKDLEYFHIETQAKEVFDVTWAWDTFIATISYALANWYNLNDAVRLWNKASWIVIWKTGTEIIKKHELV